MLQCRTSYLQRSCGAGPRAGRLAISLKKLSGPEQQVDYAARQHGPRQKLALQFTTVDVLIAQEARVGSARGWSCSPF
jgi:hypothetical protein